jgi:hypothetical protein
MIPSVSEHRQELSDQIARQRTELTLAYRDLTKPFQYTETGIAGLKALRKNGWLLALAPSAVSLIFTFFGWEKKGKGRPGLLGRFGRKARGEAAGIERDEVAQIKKPLSRWGKRAWSLFQVYRKVRPFFP